MVVEGPDRAHAHPNQQDLEVEDVRDLDGERRTGYVYRVRDISPCYNTHPLMMYEARCRCLTAPAYHITENEQYMKHDA